MYAKLLNFISEALREEMEAMDADLFQLNETLPIDFVALLPRELILNIFGYLSEADLANVASVSKAWRSAAYDPMIYLERCRRSDGKPGVWALGAGTSDLPPRLAARCLSAHLGRWREMLAELVHLQRAHEDYIFSLCAGTVSASSTDQPDQCIDHTLSGNAYFWSSSGTTTADHDDTLVYSLVQSVCIVTAVEITPYKALFHRGLPIYAPLRCRISVGFDPGAYHYQSPIFDVEKSNSPQVFSLAPEVVVGRYVKIELFGRSQQQPADGLWYLAIQQVRVFGIPAGVLASRTPVLFHSLLNFAVENGCPLADGHPDPESPCLSALAQSVKEDMNRRHEERVMLAELHDLLASSRWQQAAELVVAHYRRDPQLRTPEILSMFREAGPPLPPRGETDSYGWTTPVRVYLGVLLQEPGEGILNAHESLQLVQECLAMNEFGTIRRALGVVDGTEAKVTFSENLGDYLYTEGHHVQSRTARLFLLEAAGRVFSRATAWDKMLQSFLECGALHIVLRFVLGVNYEVNWVDVVLQVVHLHGKTRAVYFAACIAEELPTDTALHTHLGEVLGLQIPETRTALEVLLAARTSIVQAMLSHGTARVMDPSDMD